MGRIIELTTVPQGTTARPRGMGDNAAWAAIERVDVYSLTDLDLSEVTGMIVSGMCDQVYLSRHRSVLEAWVREGGRLLINGHVVEPFLEGLPKWRKLTFTQPADLEITAQTSHPLWEGIDPDDVLYRTGVPGEHSRERLTEIGVAGFYGRGYSVRLPQAALVINTIGHLQAPIDYAYPFGLGEVVVHAGLDLEAFPATPGTTLGRFAENAQTWLGGEK